MESVPVQKQQCGARATGSPTPQPRFRILALPPFCVTGSRAVSAFPPRWASLNKARNAPSQTRNRLFYCFLEVASCQGPRQPNPPCRAVQTSCPIRPPPACFGTLGRAAAKSGFRIAFGLLACRSTPPAATARPSAGWGEPAARTGAGIDAAAVCLGLPYQPRSQPRGTIEAAARFSRVLCTLGLHRPGRLPAP